MPFEDIGANQFSVYPSYASYMKPRLSLDKKMLKDMAPAELDKFFSVMIYSSRYYLKNGLLCFGDINGRSLRAPIQKTSQPFVNMMTSKVRPATRYVWIQLFDMFVEAGIFEYHEIKKFQRWVYSYGWTNNFKIVEKEEIAEKSFSLIQS